MWLSVIHNQFFVVDMVVIDAKANIKHSAYEKELGGINCALSKSQSFKNDLVSSLDFRFSALVFGVSPILIS